MVVEGNPQAAEPPLLATYCLYRALRIRPELSAIELKRAYHRAALTFHPDKKKEAADSDVENFRQAKRAFEILSDPLRRKFYDKYGDAGLMLIDSSGATGGESSSATSTSVVVFDTSTAVGQFVIKTCIHPSRLIPPLLLVAAVNFLMFFQPFLMDWRFSGWLTWRWSFVLLPLWCFDAVVLVLSMIPFVVTLKSFSLLVTVYEAEIAGVSSGLSAPNRAARLVVTNDLFNAAVYPVYVLSFIYFQKSLLRPYASSFDLIKAQLKLEAILAGARLTWLLFLLPWRKFKAVRSMMRSILWNYWSVLLRSVLLVLAFLPSVPKLYVMVWPFMFLLTAWWRNRRLAAKMQAQLRAQLADAMPDADRDDNANRLRYKFLIISWLRWIWSALVLVSAELLTLGWVNYIRDSTQSHWPCWLTFMPFTLYFLCICIITGLVLPSILFILDVSMPENQFDKFDFTGANPGKAAANDWLGAGPSGIFGYGLAPPQPRLTGQ